METKSILRSHDTAEWLCPDWRKRAVWSGVFCLVTAFLFMDLLLSFMRRWMNEPQYQHGFAIPFMAAGLGWYMSDRIRPGVARSDSWGLLWVGLGVLLHILGVYIFVEFADCLGLLACITGGILLLWGRRLTIGIWPAVFFLIFMFPLPFRIERMLSAPLQLYGAEQAAWYIQMLGIPAVARGSMILMGDHKLGVAEACSGMRMLTVFVAISVGTVIVCKRSLWENSVILLSAIPIALICNVGRIVATAVAYNVFGDKMADLVFHDLSGWLMMPSAMLMLWLLLKLLDWLFIEAPEADRRLRTVARKGIPGIPRVSKPPVANS
jgi:exosortase